MSLRPFILLLSPALMVFATPSAQADVFELGSNGNWVNITPEPWQPEAVIGEDAARVAVAPSVIGATDPKASYVQQHIQQAASRYGVSNALLDAVAWQESRYNHRALSSAGAIGVMQLMPATARSLGVSDPKDVAQNVAGGAAYLRQQLERFGNNVPLALAAYNAGPGAVLRHGGIPPYQETQNYVRQIMGRLARTAMVFEAY